MKRLTSLIILSYLIIFVIFPPISFSSTQGINVISEIRNCEKRQKPHSIFKEANCIVAKSQPDKKQREPKLAINSINTPLEIKDITFNLKKRGKEIVAIYANRSFKPTVFAIEEYPPRIVIDIINISTFRRDLTLIPVNGKLIKRIRCYLHEDTQTLRIVLDASESNEYYKVNQFFFEGNKVYVLEVMGKEKESPTELKDVN